MATPIRYDRSQLENVVRMRTARITPDARGADNAPRAVPTSSVVTPISRNGDTVAFKVGNRIVSISSEEGKAIANQKEISQRNRMPSPGERIDAANEARAKANAKGKGSSSGGSKGGGGGTGGGFSGGGGSGSGNNASSGGSSASNSSTPDPAQERRDASRGWGIATEIRSGQSVGEPDPDELPQAVIDILEEGDVLEFDVLQDEFGTLLYNSRLITAEDQALAAAALTSHGTLMAGIAAIADFVNIDKVTKLLSIPGANAGSVLADNLSNLGDDRVLKTAAFGDRQVWWVGYMAGAVAQKLELVSVQAVLKEFADEDEFELNGTGTSFTEVESPDGTRYQIVCDFTSGALKDFVENYVRNYGSPVAVPFEIRFAFGYNPLSVESTAATDIQGVENGGSASLDFKIGSEDELDYALTLTVVDPTDSRATLEFEVDFTAEKTGSTYDVSAVTGDLTQLVAGAQRGNVFPLLLPSVSLAIVGTSTGVQVGLTVAVSSTTGLSWEEKAWPSNSGTPSGSLLLAEPVEMWRVKVPLEKWAWASSGAAHSSLFAGASPGDETFTVTAGGTTGTFTISHPAPSLGYSAGGIRNTLMNAALSGMGITLDHENVFVLHPGVTDSMTFYFAEDPQFDSISSAGGAVYPVEHFPNGPSMALEAAGELSELVDDEYDAPALPVIHSQKGVMQLENPLNEN